MTKVLEERFWKLLVKGLRDDMKFQHKLLANGRWAEMSLMEQMANVGSEVERAISWKNKDNLEYSRQAIYRALELLQLTKSDKQNSSSLKELCRVYEALGDYFVGENKYHSTDDQWRRYFYVFNYAARRYK